jgi:hypothetical protein
MGKKYIKNRGQFRENTVTPKLGDERNGEGGLTRLFGFSGGE